MSLLEKLNLRIYFCIVFFIIFLFMGFFLYLFICYKRPIFRVLIGFFSTILAILIFISCITFYYRDQLINNQNINLNNNITGNANNLNINLNNNITDNANNLNQDINIHNNQNIDFSIIIKIDSINDLNQNFNNNCPLCLDLVVLKDSYKLSNCNYHIFHNECLIKYVKNNFEKCPICNI